jgi:type IV pilus assembly protein PilE
MKRLQQGFSLIEIMIVVAIVGIITAIAIPNYTEYVARGHRADARAGLLQAQQWMERASTARGTYPLTIPAELTWAADTTKRYTVGFQAGNTNSAFTLVATRRAGGSQASDRCGDFTLTNTGTRGANNLASGTTAAECWNR